MPISPTPPSFTRPLTQTTALALGAACLLMTITTSSASAQNERCNLGVANCTIMTGVKNCTRTWMDTQGYSAVTTATNGPASCSHTVLNPNGGAPGVSIRFNAMRNTTAAPTAGCTFDWNYIPGPFPQRCTIDMADGLPVELMEFSVEENSETTDEEED